MALSESVYFEARKKYETGQSLNSIARDLRISKSNLARIAKREGWEQGKYKDYVEAKITIKEQEKKIKQDLQKENGNYYDKFRLLDSIALNEAEKRELVNNVSILTLKRAESLLKKGTIRKHIKVSNGVAVGESLEKVEEELTPRDLRDIADLADKASMTLKVNPRFAPQMQQVIGANEVKVIAPFGDKIEK